MHRLLPFLFLALISCQPDELVIIKGSKVQVITKEQTYEVSDEDKPCPPCPGNTYCNRKTGKCEGAAIDKIKPVEVKKNPREDYNLNGKPISVDRLVWMDHGGPVRNHLID